MQLELFQQWQQLEIVFPKGYYVHREVIKTLEAEKKAWWGTERDKQKAEQEIEAQKQAMMKP